jgi:hypothetical protein
LELLHPYQLIYGGLPKLYFRAVKEQKGEPTEKGPP